MNEVLFFLVTVVLLVLLIRASLADFRRSSPWTEFGKCGRCGEYRPRKIELGRGLEPCPNCGYRFTEAGSSVLRKTVNGKVIEVPDD